MIYAMFRIIDWELTERTDRKQLADAISSLFFPWLVVIKFNPRTDLFLMPILFIANTATMNASFDTESGNMDCFSEPGFYKNA